MHAIEILELRKTFKGEKRTRVEALKGVSLAVERGEVFGFLGPNGAGKSTTIKILLGLIRPTGGKAMVLGVDAGSPKARMRVGYLPENPAFFDYLKGEEYLAFVGSCFGLNRATIEERSAAILQRLDLWEARKRPVRTYSKGMVQRLGLAQVLIHDPDVYILDEPMSGLDPVGRAIVKEIIVELKRSGKCVLFSTHVTADVETVCDRVGILTKGILQSVEQVKTILTEGITGYRVYLKGARGTEETGEFQVSKESLPAFIAACSGRGDEIVLIEPQRKNLEAFFLDIIKKKTC